MLFGGLFCLKKYFSIGISREFTYSPLFPWKNQSSLLEKLVASASFKKRHMFCPLPTCNSLYFEQTYTNQNIITVCAITFCVTFMYYILRQKLLHFALPTLLHFASKVTTFCVTITFCGKSYYILRYYYILCQLLHFVA